MLSIKPAKGKIVTTDVGSRFADFLIHQEVSVLRDQQLQLQMNLNTCSAG